MYIVYSSSTNSVYCIMYIICVTVCRIFYLKLYNSNEQLHGQN